MLQSDVIDFLQFPDSYDLPESEKIERFDTHISVVFLAGQNAFKLKRAIKLPFVDFTTLEAREKFCRMELRVNRNGAPGMYLDVVPVVENGGVLSLGGEGRVVDWLVKMQRFDQADLFDTLCNQGNLSMKMIESLCDHLVDVYKQAAHDHDYGGEQGMKRAFAGHYKAFDNCPPSVLPTEKIKNLKDRVKSEITLQAALLNDRQESGFVRQCHGDLHLRNICLFKGKVALFDAIEFEADYAVIDIFYDLSFLIMDLCHRQREDLANAVLNRYLGLSGDVIGLNLLGLFLSSRSAIRTHVNAVASANQPDEDEKKNLEKDAGIYLDEAIAYLEPKSPVLVAIGGLSGSGKSVLAKKLAPALGKKPGAYIARTDMIRKRLMGVRPEEKLGEYGYSKGVSAHTYNTLFVEMRMALHAGYSVIVDGVFARDEERKTLREIATSMDIPFVGFWLEADHDILEERVNKRSGDVSDADGAIVRMQQAYDVGDLDWMEIDAVQPVETVYEIASSAIKETMDFQAK